MKIRTNSDSLITVFEDEDNSNEEFFSKDSIIDADFVDFNTSMHKTHIFAMFQFGDGSVFSIPIEDFVIVESCQKYDNDLLELINQ